MSDAAFDFAKAMERGTTLREAFDAGLEAGRAEQALALQEAKRHSGRCVDCKKWTCGFCGISNLTGEWRCYGCNGTDSMQLALQESQHRVKELEQRLAEECPLHQRRLKIIHQQQTIIQELAEALREIQNTTAETLTSDRAKAATEAAAPWLRKEDKIDLPGFRLTVPDGDSQL